MRLDISLTVSTIGQGDEGQGQDEAARELGITQASFSKRLNRALDKLKEHLSEAFEN